MKLLILSFAFSIVSIVFMPFSVGLHTLFLSFDVPVISLFLSSEYRVSRLCPSLLGDGICCE